MITLQDLQNITYTERNMAEFTRAVIEDHKHSELYTTAVIAEEYDRCRNRTIAQYEKTLVNVRGDIIRDEWSPNHKCTSNFFNIFTTQLNQYLLGNGVSWKDGVAKDKLGVNFDTRLQQAGKAALVGGVSFGFWNLDHLEDFKATEFAPIYDEENGAMAAGVRWWQIDDTKPMRATLYEMDGYTNFLWQPDDRKAPNDTLWSLVDSGCYMQPKKAYKVKTGNSDARGEEYYNGENYPAFPIVPLWGNPNHQSELVGMREKIDAYDLILNGYENDLDNAQIYWIIKGAAGLSGSDSTDLLRFMERLRKVGGAALGEDQEVTPVPVEIPAQARELLLDRLEKQLYKDAMIMNPADIAGGAATATQIRAAYEPQNVKADQFEYCVLDFLNGILKVAGVDDEPSFTRSMIVNTQEEIQTLVTAGSYLSQEYLTKKVLTLLGDGDKAEEVLQQMDAEAVDRLGEFEDMTQTGNGDGAQGDDAETGENEETPAGMLNGAQTSSLINVITKYQANEISEGQAIRILMKAIGVDREEALGILHGR